VTLARVVARSTGKLAALSLPAGAATSTRLEDILEDATIEAVLVLTPPHSHLEIVEQLARAGKHVLVEKPLEVSLDKACQMVEICEHSGVKLAVMLQHRMRDAARALMQLVRSGDMGSLVGASASIRWWRPQSYYDEPGRGTLARDGGGVLMTQAIHTLDLLLCLTGMPEQVSAMAGTSALHRMECEDTVAAALRYPNGAIGSIDATTAAYPGFPERIALQFTQGSATLEAGELHAELLDGRKIHAGQKQASGSGANLMAFDHHAHRAVLQDFVAAIRSDAEPAVSGRSALQVHQLIAAMMKSAGSGAAVSPLA
jgi:predicted dehydrogenase